MKKKEMAKKMGGYTERKIHKVSDYNREGERRYREAVSKYEPGKGGFPHPGMYRYSREKTGEPYKRGSVVSWKHSEGGSGSHYFLKRKDAQKYLEGLK